MLSELHIQNIAVIQKAAITFGEGFNVFTGETGAGKTVLISAIDAVLGERTSKEIVRSGEEKALVTALFTNISSRAKDMLKELGYADEEGDLLISREITIAGKTNCKIGGVPATAAILKQISPLLIHIHGQRDSTQLLEPQRHIFMIDTFGELFDELSRYRQVYHSMQETRKKLADTQMDESIKAQRIDMLKFQTCEIEGAELENLNEEEELALQKKLIKNSEKVRKDIHMAYSTLKGGGDSLGITSMMDTLNQSIASAAEYIHSLLPAAKRLEEMGYELEEYAVDIRLALDDDIFDPNELEKIEDRLDIIYKLKRKYGGDVAAILEYYNKAVAELDSLERSDELVAKLKNTLALEETAATKAAKALSNRRQKAAESFVLQAQQELVFLDMPSVKLSIKREEKPLSPDGCDEIEFYISTNLGEQPKPLAKIASGGEISRIMLAIKNVIAEKDDIDTLIFDEVDTGVSGRAAQKIGKKLKQVAAARQVICVTHLAQVAAFADKHILIKKEVDGVRTYTKIAELDSQARINEIARITSGEHLTDAALKNAAELIEQSK